MQASRRWKDRNAERLRAYRQEYNADPENRERNIERARRFRERNRDQIVDYRRRLYEEHQQATNAATVRAYRLSHPGKQAEIEGRRRARLLGGVVEPVDPARIRERDDGLCGICGESVPIHQQSLDHIVPLALGGHHVETNLQLAHLSCNSRKGIKLL